MEKKIEAYAVEQAKKEDELLDSFRKVCNRLISSRGYTKEACRVEAGLAKITFGNIFDEHKHKYSNSILTRISKFNRDRFVLAYRYDHTRANDIALGTIKHKGITKRPNGCLVTPKKEEVKYRPIHLHKTLFPNVLHDAVHKIPDADKIAAELMKHDVEQEVGRAFIKKLFFWELIALAGDKLPDNVIVDIELKHKK
jgi:hypothetical protein